MKEINRVIGFFFLLSWIICSSQPLHFVYVFLTKNSTSPGCSQGRVSLALTLAKIRKPPSLSSKLSTGHFLVGRVIPFLDFASHCVVTHFILLTQNCRSFNSVLLRRSVRLRFTSAYAKSATRSRTPLKKIKYLF
jgi:hypothetical protein